MSPAKTLVSAAVAAVVTSGVAFAQDYRLVMVEQPGCAYCAAWDDQIAHAYPNTQEGQYAPLLRADLHMGPPEGITYARKVNFTPTFILTEDGQEIARIEGYVGEDFFWPVYAQLLQDNTNYEPATH